MTQVLVLYHSSYGHIETMAGAVAGGVRSAGAEATIRRVPELVPDEIARRSGIRLDLAAPVATVVEGARYQGRHVAQVAAKLARPA